MHSYVLSNGQKHFVSHMFAMLQRWFFGTHFTFKLYRCKPSSLLYNAQNSQPQFIFWTWFLFNLSLYNQALNLLKNHIVSRLAHTEFGKSLQNLFYIFQKLINVTKHVCSTKDTLPSIDNTSNRKHSSLNVFSFYL